MSKSSRRVQYIPTTWPHERTKVKKSSQQMKMEKLCDQSKNIWKKNLIQKYEERPKELMLITLSEFVAYYYCNSNGEFVRRKFPKVIRYRNYDSKDKSEHIREMVLLYYPFQNKEIDILDNNKFLQIFEENQKSIIANKKCFEYDMDFDATLQMCMNLMQESFDISDNKRKEFENSKLITINVEDCDDMDHNALEDIPYEKVGHVIQKRNNLMSKSEYCKAIRSTNMQQKALILETINRIKNVDNEPMQIHLAGSAGTGKTYLLNMIMETCNRFSQKHNSIFNSYVVCAPTGKAASALGGSTVHSTFRISTSRVTLHCQSSSYIYIEAFLQMLSLS